MTAAQLQAQVAFVTGGGSGIGKATALLLAREGATVVVADIALASAQAVANEINTAGGQALAVSLDVSQAAAWQQAIDTTLQHFQRLDVLVNNAGISYAQSIESMSLEAWRKVLAVNLDGVFLGTKHAIAAMKRGGGGSIVNVASVSGIKPSPTASAYCASKAAVRIFSKTAAI